MTVTANHKFVSGKADGADPTFVQPSKWNQAHNFGGGSDGQALVRDSTQTEGADWVAPDLLGTSRLVFTNATTLTLQTGCIPLKIGGTWKRKFSAAVTVGTGGLAASTTYFVYAFDNAGTTTLELSTTGHVTDATFGVEVKSGDATRTLVGMVRTTGATQFIDTAQNRLVVSYYNRRTIAFQNAANGGNPATASAALVELAANWRCAVLCWADEAVLAQAAVTASHNVNNGAIGFAIGFDGTPFTAAVSMQDYLATAVLGVATSGIVAAPSEGLHTLSPFGSANAGGTSTYIDSVGVLTGIIRG